MTDFNHDFETGQNSNTVDNPSNQRELVDNVQLFVSKLAELCDDGIANSLEAFATIKRLETIIKEAKKKIEPCAFHEMVHCEKVHTIGNVKFQVIEGRKTYDFEKDAVYKELQEKLNNRETLLKTVTEKNQELYDEDGVKLESVPVTFAKNSLRVTFVK